MELIDFTDKFTAELLLFGLFSAHDALWSGHHGNAETAVNFFKLGGFYIDALARFADAFQVEIFALRVEHDLDLFEVAVLDGVVFLDKSAFLEDLKHAQLNAGVRSRDDAFAGHGGIADAGQEVCNGIC